MNTSNQQMEMEDDGDLQSLFELIDNQLKKVRELPIEKKISKNRDVISMIGYYNKLTESIEGRRINVAQTSWNSLGMLVTALGVIVALDIILLVKYLILLILIIQIVVSILKIYEYQKQSAYRYPFLKLQEFGNRWKWFYYANPHITSINTSPSSTNPISADNKNYLDGLNFFLEKYVEEDIDKEISDNLIQLYLLQVHNYIKNKFYLRFFTYDKWSVIITILSLSIYLIILLILRSNTEIMNSLVS